MVATVQVMKLLVVILILLVAAFAAASNADDESSCVYVVEAKPSELHLVDTTVLFITYRKITGIDDRFIRVWHRRGIMRVPVPEDRSCPGAFDQFMFIVRMRCTDPCRLELRLDDFGELPQSVRIRTYDGGSGAEKFVRNFSVPLLSGGKVIVNQCPLN